MGFKVFLFADLPLRTPNREWIENDEIRWRALETGRRWRLQSLSTFTSSSESRATGGGGTPIFSAATWRLTKLTSSHRLVCWQAVHKATANSSPWCSWAGGTHIRLTHQGSSSWCAEVSWCRVELFPPSLVVKPQPWREYWSPSTGRWSRGVRVCVKHKRKKIKIQCSAWLKPLVWQIGIGSPGV